MGETILNALVAMSRELGDPQKGYAILGEGNASARVDDDTFYVTASGTNLSTITAEEFVAVSVSRILGLLDDESVSDAEVRKGLRRAKIDPDDPLPPSIESLLHAVLLDVPEYKFIGHTHPPQTNMLLCSIHAEEAVSGRVFPDQVVSMGHKSVFVPYVDPGLVLAREVRTRLEAFVEAEGVLPRVIMMENHGVFVMGGSAAAVTSCMDMTEKSSKIVVGAYQAGGPNFMSPEHVERIHTRPDEAYRLKQIAR